MRGIALAQRMEWNFVLVTGVLVFHKVHVFSVCMGLPAKTYPNTVFVCQSQNVLASRPVQCCLFETTFENEFLYKILYSKSNKLLSAQMRRLAISSLWEGRSTVLLPCYIFCSWCLHPLMECCAPLDFFSVPCLCESPLSSRISFFIPFSLFKPQRADIERM